jgi:predicted dehydrogenase
MMALMHRHMLGRSIRYLRPLPLLSFIAGAGAADLRIGFIGLDTSHSVAFAKLLNEPGNSGHIPGGRVTRSWKGGSPDIEASASRVDGFAADIARTYGVTPCDSIESVMSDVDAVMVLSLDGRTHLGEARRIFPFHKPVFIDKPLAGSLRDAIDIFRLAQQLHAPCFSASAERFTSDVPKLKQARIGHLNGVSTFGPAQIESHHPDLYWYGIHAVEKCYALMGTGCETVVRVHTPDTDVVTGVWHDGRVATVRGNRNTRYAFGVTEFGSEAVVVGEQAEGYEGLVTEILQFFRTGIAPVSHAETIEVLTFMEAADESKRRGGIPVSLAEVLRANGGADGI